MPHDVLKLTVQIASGKKEGLLSAEDVLSAESEKEVVRLVRKLLKEFRRDEVWETANPGKTVHPNFAARMAL